MPQYLEELTARLVQGAAGWPDERRQRHADYLQGAQNNDGGFSGREGASDLYYTGFALRGLALVGALEGDTARRAGEFLSGRLADRAPVIDLLSLLYGAVLLRSWAGENPLSRAAEGWQDAVTTTLESYRREDGGYAKTPQGATSSTYYTFLILLCYQLLDQPVVNPAAIVEFIRSRRRDDGGFVEVPQVARSATNPTAAAIGVLKILDALDDPIRAGASRLLAAMQTDEGGLRANTRIPLADLLSTFTGLLTLVDLGTLDCVDIRAAERYVTSLELPEGGYRAATWDPRGDLEYTFYGLGAKALVDARTE